MPRIGRRRSPSRAARTPFLAAAALAAASALLLAGCGGPGLTGTTPPDGGETTVEETPVETVTVEEALAAMTALLPAGDGLDVVDDEGLAQTSFGAEFIRPDGSSYDDYRLARVLRSTTAVNWSIIVEVVLMEDAELVQMIVDDFESQSAVEASLDTEVGYVTYYPQAADPRAEYPAGTVQRGIRIDNGQFITTGHYSMLPQGQYLMILTVYTLEGEDPNSPAEASAQLDEVLPALMSDLAALPRVELP